MVIAGQGTAALELISDVPDLDIVMAPVDRAGPLSASGAWHIARNVPTQTVTWHSAV